MTKYEQPPDSSILAYARRAAPAAWGITATTQQGRIVEREAGAWLVEFTLARAPQSSLKSRRSQKASSHEPLRWKERGTRDEQ